MSSVLFSEWLELDEKITYGFRAPWCCGTLPSQCLFISKEYSLDDQHLEKS